MHTLSLKRGANISANASRVVIAYLADEITLTGRTAELFGKMRPHLDGTRGVDRIADEVAEPVERVRALAAELERVGVVADVSVDPPPMTGEAFYALHHRLCGAWLEPVYQHRLWDKIVSGRATRAQVLGFAFEKYHYIEAAYEHMALAAANATPELMPHLARHFIEEHNHGDIYRKGLSSLFPDEVILTAQPLPSTRALVNFLSESAVRCSFSYYAGNELLQMTENTGDPSAQGSVDSFYEAMRRHYPYTGPLIDSFVAHTRADQKLGHEDVFFEMCRAVPPLSHAQVTDALNTVRSMAEHLQLFMDGIDVFYERFPTVPRLPCELGSE
jgi:pyrroloquinoline quinone (PQQ) biosynthesis protein C